MHSRLLAAVSVLFLGLALLGVAPAPQTPANAQAEEEITALANRFIDAFGQGDAQALAAFWTPDGDVVDLAGRTLRGRDAIAADYAELFEHNKGLTLRIEVLSRRFPTPETAVEDGVTSVLGPKGTLPSRARYTNTLVKRDGSWLLSSVRESPYTPPNHTEHLAPLAWMIGAWAQQAPDGASPDGGVSRVIFDWTPDGNFIVARRAVSVGDRLLDAGTERIGWDPAGKYIRSWSFEPDGGFSEATWSSGAISGTGAGGAPPVETWTSRSSAVLSSGSLMTSTAVMTRVDADTVTWQSRSRRIDGQPQPDSPVITMKRVR
jgi:uncharacterized protein (TIGR02246 family)